MSNSVIDISNLSKVYKLYDKPIDILKESLSITKKLYHKNYYALKDINLNVSKGEILGIIGTNGSGKSTLLKIITGVLNPSAGQVNVNGTISALLELGAGFNPEYTGLQNIYLNGTMMNKTRDEIEREIQGIIDFAEIGDFINQPVKTYSSGMFVRLAFAVATNIKPDILVVDEALSVGDINFQMKSINKIKELIKNGATVLFVSHDIITIKSLCNKVLYLEKGNVVAYGESGEICDLYIKNQNRRSGLTGSKENTEHIEPKEDLQVEEPSDKNDEFIEIINEHEGTGKARITNIVTLNNNAQSKEFYYKEPITVKVYFDIIENIESLVVALYIRNRNQLEIIGTNTKYEGITFNNLNKGSKYVAKFKFENYLKEGEYGFSTILADNIPTTEYYDVVNNLPIIKSYDLVEQKRWALVGIPISVECREAKDDAR